MTMMMMMMMKMAVHDLPEVEVEMWRERLENPLLPVSKLFMMAAELLHFNCTIT
jgi:hypothetical protein